MLQCLGLVQSTVKLQLMGESFSEQTCDEQHYDLCRYLYRLHFQVFLFIENYAKLVNALHNVAAAHDVTFHFANWIVPNVHCCVLLRCWTCPPISDLSGLDCIKRWRKSNWTPTGAWPRQPTFPPEILPFKKSWIAKSWNTAYLNCWWTRGFSKPWDWPVNIGNSARFYLLHIYITQIFLFAANVGLMIISEQVTTKKLPPSWGSTANMYPARSRVRLGTIILIGRFKNCLFFFPAAVIATIPDESSLADSSSAIMDFNMQTQSSLKSMEKSLMNFTETRSDRSDYSVRKTECWDACIEATLVTEKALDGNL